jgi:hypothetical protein
MATSWISKDLLLGWISKWFGRKSYFVDIPENRRELSFRQFIQNFFK